MSTRLSKKVKNLEQEVDFIFSQGESDEDCKTVVNGNEIIPKTPQTNRVKDVATPKSSHAVLQELLQTPRRSCRKSIKPSQDYEDIIKKSTRSCPRAPNRHLMTENKEANREAEIVPPKWTPAKVGRVSQKRSRKSRRTKAKLHDDNETKQLEEQAKSNEKHGQTEEVPKKAEKLGEEISGHNEQVDKIESNENIEHLSEPTLEEAAREGLPEPNKAIEVEIVTQEKQVDEIVNNMEHLNVKTEYKNCQENKNLKQEQLHADNDLDDVFRANEPLILIQEDSEDCEEFAENSEQQGICIVYENNISNHESSPKSDAQGENVEEGSFGCYLKSKEINLSDLGLNPLKEEEEKTVMEADSRLKVNLKESEDMPSLIVFDDDEEVRLCEKLNETFEANDYVKILGAINESDTKSREEIMETLEVSDDEDETPRKRPRVSLNDAQLQNNLLLSTPKDFTIEAKLPSTPKALLSTPKVTGGSTQSTKIIRHPTPYTNKKRFKSNSEVKDNITKSTTSEDYSDTSITALTILEPKEIVLRGIRKRSFSVCIEGYEQKCHKLPVGPLAKVKRDRVVSFYSPANQTAIIDELDVKIAKSLKKQKPQENNLLNKFVTTRRKRSISFDESILSNSLLPRPVVTIANKSQTSSTVSKPLPRTKLPNFAAIHQKQFKKMENLVEHVNRKQERSKNLINSATKLKPVSAQKFVSIKNSNNNISTEKAKASKKIDAGNISQMNKSLLNSKVTAGTPNKTQEVSVSIKKNSNNISTEKPKASKKIDLGNISQINKSLLKTQEVPETTKMINLPDPRFCETKAIKLGTRSRRVQLQPIDKYLKPSQTINIEKPRLNTKTAAPQKPSFNLSTSLMVKPTSSTNLQEFANASHISGDKMSSRLQRHIDLFKGRNHSTRAVVASRKNENILKGVRSNRRFELQMQHRKNLEQ